MALAKFISKIVESITKVTFQFNKTLDVLIERFKGGCPTTDELILLIDQKNQINGALDQISAGKTVIKQIPIPSSVPPGIGLPLSVTNNLADSLDNLGTLIEKEEASLASIPEALKLISKDVGEVITKLNEFDVALNLCIEKDPNINADNLNDLNFEIEGSGLTEAELEKILLTPPGLLYGDYYLRLSFPPTDTSLIKKQIIAQNKESVPPPGEFYNENISVEELLGDESFSSSNIVLVNEMKWLIDTKDLIFLPPPPQEDPLKAIYRENQIIILMSLFGANREEAEELYELAWELSQNKGPTAFYYDQLVQEAFDNSRTVLEQAVANEGYEWQQGDRILNSTIKTLFLANYASTVSEQELMGAISQIRSQARNLENKANNVGENYNPTTKRWNKDGDFANVDSKLYPYSERLALTAENQFNDNTLGSEFVNLRPEMAKRKPLMQAVFEVANYQFLAGRPYNFNDPLEDYFLSKGYGYNQPIINEIPISGNANEPITSEELNNIYQSEITIVENINLRPDNLLPPEYTTSSDGLTYEQKDAYAKTQVYLKLKDALGMVWYNQNAQRTSEFVFWSVGGGNPQSQTYQQNNPNKNLTTADKWYFEFGRNGLPIPTGL